MSWFSPFVPELFSFFAQWVPLPIMMDAVYSLASVMNTPVLEKMVKAVSIKINQLEKLHLFSLKLHVPF